MNYRIPFAVLLLAGSLNALAHDGDSYFLNEGDRRIQRLDRETKEFSESTIELPPVPDPKQGEWFELYVEKMFSGKPAILMDSISYAPDGSVRYLLNNRSSGGFDNITAEGMLCITGSKFFGSEGARLKTYGYADLANKRWIQPRNAQWQSIGGKRNATDRVRRVLYDAFCIDGLAKNDAALRERVRKQVGPHAKPDYSR